LANTSPAGERVTRYCTETSPPQKSPFYYTPILGIEEYYHELCYKLNLFKVFLEYNIHKEAYAIKVHTNEEYKP